jgi:hypothetical protein
LPLSTIRSPNISNHFFTFSSIPSGVGVSVIVGVSVSVVRITVGVGVAHEALNASHGCCVTKKVLPSGPMQAIVGDTLAFVVCS